MKKLVRLLHFPSPIFPMLWVLTLGLYACESLVTTIPDSKLPKVESQLTLFGFLSPQDTLIRIKVGQTRAILSEYTTGDSLYYVLDGDTLQGVDDSFPGATVVLAGPESRITLKYDPIERVYSASTKTFPIRGGQKYTLTVTDGKRTATANCTVPSESIPILDYTLDTTITPTLSRPDTTLLLTYTWQDLPGKSNYYRIRAYEKVEYSIVDFNPNTNNLNERRTVGLFNFNWSGAGGRRDYFSDEKLDGTTFSTPLGRKDLQRTQTFGFLDGKPIEPKEKPKSLGVYLVLLNTDFNYYQFHLSVRQARRDNPFAEPALVYSNVSGGLGILAGLNQSIRLVKP